MLDIPQLEQRVAEARRKNLLILTGKDVMDDDLKDRADQYKEKHYNSPIEMTAAQSQKAENSRLAKGSLIGNDSSSVSDDHFSRITALENSVKSIIASSSRNGMDARQRLI